MRRQVRRGCTEEKAMPGRHGLREEHFFSGGGPFGRYGPAGEATGGTCLEARPRGPSGTRSATSCSTPSRSSLGTATKSCRPSPSAAEGRIGGARASSTRGSSFWKNWGTRAWRSRTAARSAPLPRRVRWTSSSTATRSGTSTRDPAPTAGKSTPTSWET